MPKWLTAVLKWAGLTLGREAITEIEKKLPPKG